MNLRFKTLLNFCILGSLFLFFLSFVYAAEFSSPSFSVKDPIIKAGSGFSTSTGFQLWSSIGQEAIGTSSASAFGLRGGFLYFPAPAPPPPPSPPPGGLPPPTTGGGSLPLDQFEKLSQLQITLPEIFPRPCELPADFNCDGVVGFVDLSILLYYFNKPLNIAGFYDLTRDGTLDTADISVLFYYWNEYRA